MVFLLGCGRIEFDPRTDAAFVAPLDAPANSDCWDAWASGLPALTPATRVVELSSPGIEHDMTVVADGTQLYFSSDRAGSLGMNDIFVALRDGPSGPFTRIEHVPSLSSTTGDGPFFTRDGLTGILASARFGAGAAGGSDFWFAQRATHEEPFTLTHTGTELNTPGADYDAWLSLDGLRLYYSTSAVITMSARATLTDPWNPPVQVPGVNAAGEYDPSLSPDERVMVFTSHRLSPERDVFVATRSDREVPFSTPVSVDAITTTAAEYDPHIAPDGCSIYFASDRDGASGELEIHVTHVVR